MPTQPEDPEEGVGAAPLPARRRRRRAVRPADGPPDVDDRWAAQRATPPVQTKDDTDAGWGEATPESDDSRDRWLRDQRPPHHGG